jgi:uncharacterized protein (TIGR03437 family)
VSLTVQPPPVQPILSIDSKALALNLVEGSSSQTAQIRVANAGGGTLSFTAVATTLSGGQWLSVSPTTGVAKPDLPSALTVIASAATLQAGIYQGKIAIVDGSVTESVSVTLSVSSPNQILLLSQSALSFTTVAQGGAPSYPSNGPPAILGVSTGLGGLYQITVTVPNGVGSGQASILISSAGQTSQAGVTLAITGSATSNMPVITAVSTAGGFPDIAQNDWVQITGTNLAPASVGPNGLTWGSAPEFASGRMPMQLSGVSATVNGKPAFVYYVSVNQLNILSPLDTTLGPVQIVVTNGSVSSTPFTATMRAAAPSFPLVGNYIVATHADNSLIGPTSLSVPGYPFTPAHPNETIVLYAFGFGLPTTTLTNGSSSQVGPLPTFPVIQIGATLANVVYAGVISPGLYQFNVIVPATAANGDNAVTCSYSGLNAPAGALINVQR